MYLFHILNSYMRLILNTYLIIQCLFVERFLSFLFGEKTKFPSWAFPYLSSFKKNLPFLHKYAIWVVVLESLDITV